MKLLLASLLLSSLVTLASADINLVDNDQTIEIDCAKDRDVNLVGNHLTVTLQGVCNDVSINGNHTTFTGSAREIRIAGNDNRATVAQADTIEVAGNHNVVTYTNKGVTGDRTSVSAPGTGNKITQKK